MNEIDIKLKPCPFCGFEFIEIDSPNGLDKRVICNKGKGGCGVQLGWFISIKELKKAWNQRVKRVRYNKDTKQSPDYLYSKWQ